MPRAEVASKVGRRVDFESSYLGFNHTPTTVGFLQFRLALEVHGAALQEAADREALDRRGERVGFGGKYLVVAPAGLPAVGSDTHRGLPLHGIELHALAFMFKAVCLCHAFE